MNKLLLALAAVLLLAGRASAQATPDLLPTPPAWIIQGNVYEVNVRQYTPEGTFNAFAKHLDRLKAMGVQTLWFMPLNPISKKARKGSLGSYYAVADYQKINPEFGTMADWQRLVKGIHDRGMKVIIDWVPNHTGADHGWLRRHPDFFVEDPKTGQPTVAFDWADARQLNYKNREMQDSMIAAMRYWLVKSDIDGFRCDVAWNVPGSFWKRAIPALEKPRNLFFLAEGDSAYLPRRGFDAVYPWHMFKAMAKLAAGQRPATVLDTMWNWQNKMYPASTIQMYFTSNHDENTWNKADYGLFPGPEHAPFAVFTQTMGHGVPLVYSGQEEPVKRSLEFFDKDPITFGNYERADFYRTLLNLRKRNPALAPDASFYKLKLANPKQVYAFTREKAGEMVLVVLNMSAVPQTVTLTDKSLAGKPRNVFSSTDAWVADQPLQLEPWGYRVYEYRADVNGNYTKNKY